LKGRPTKAEGGVDHAVSKRESAAACVDTSILRKGAQVITGLAIIVCFALSIAGVRLAPIGLGLGSMIAYPLAPPHPKWVKRLLFAAALCGAGTITLTIVELAGG